MLYIINDTSIKILDKAYSNSQGGTSAFLAGFINYFLSNKIVFGLIGNFEVENNLKKNTYFSNPSTNLLFLGYLLKLFLYKKFNQKDILYFQRPDHLACSLFSKKKRILHLHGQPRTTIISNRNLITKFIYLALERIAMHFADLILVTDKKSEEVYLVNYPFIEKKIKVVPAGIDLNFFCTTTNDSKQDLNNNQRKELVYIGRLAPPKQLPEILNAFKIVSDSFINCHLNITGKGPLLNNLVQSVRDMGLSDKVSFTGVLSKKEIKELILMSDAAILLSNNEGSPISIKEVLACGKPVIVNDVGDFSDYVVNGKNGFVVNAENSYEVAAAVEKAFKNGESMRDYCISSVLQFDEKVINQTIVNYILGST